METQSENSIPLIPRRRGRPPKNAQLQAPTPVAAVMVHDVVQVTNPNSTYYGVLFQVGDIQKGMAHGFHMLSGGRREYVTIGIDECKAIGPSRVRSKDPTSPQWKSEMSKQAVA